MTNTEKLIFAFMVIPVGFCFTMMELWKTFEMTDGSSQYGHPDFKGIYESVCMPKYRMTDL